MVGVCCKCGRNYFDSDGEGGRYDDMTTFAKMSAGGAGMYTTLHITYNTQYNIIQRSEELLVLDRY